MSEHVKSDLPAYFNGDLSETKRLDVEKHLGECSSCLHAANKIRAKSSRVKRQALKSALPDRIPNLLLNRLVRQTDIAPRASSFPWAILIVVLMVLAVGAWFIHRPVHWKGWKGMPLWHMPSVPVEISTSSAAAFDVERSSPAAVRNVAETAVVPSAASVSTPVPIVAAEPASNNSASGVVPQWGGDDSNIKESRQVVVRSRPAWRALWNEMGQTGSAPHVNFNDVVIIGIFAGERAPGQYQISFEPPVDQDDAVIIPYKISGPLATTSAGTSTVHPYLLTTIQRSPKPVRFRSESS